jgi:sulfate/thiosulfate transport system substrate-binding protein
VREGPGALILYGASVWPVQIAEAFRAPRKRYVLFITPRRGSIGVKGYPRWLNVGAVGAVIAAFAMILAKNAPGSTGNQLLNVSYDPTRELYQKLDDEFVQEHQKQSGRRFEIVQSHGGSGRQVRKVISGEEPADVVTLALYSDIDALSMRGLIANNWAERLPNHSVPYTSTIVFVVRQGNPRHIRDWPDLVRPDVEIVTPDPKTSGNGRLSILAAWGAITTRGGSEAQAREYLKAFYKNAPEMDPGAQAAAMTFTLREIGDVQLAWENTAIAETAQSGGKLQIVYPPVSILAEPCVAWVDANVKRRGTEAAAQAYLDFLFTDQAQVTMASLGYRPYKEEVLHQSKVHFPQIKLFPITAIAQSWDDAQQKFFGDNGIIASITGS